MTGTDRIVGRAQPAIRGGCALRGCEITSRTKNISDIFEFPLDVRLVGYF